MTFASATTAIQTPRSVNVTIKLDASDRDRLRSLAAAKKRTSHYIMKEAIQRYIREEEIEERFISAAEASWEDFEKTGLHITLDEAKNWAKALKKNLMPRCLHATSKAFKASTKRPATPICIPRQMGCRHRARRNRYDPFLV